MVSGSKPPTIDAATTPVPWREALRLTLKPNGAAMGAVDGGWWPRSRDPLAEFPAVIAGIVLRVGRVDRLAYNMTVWSDAPRRMVVDGRTIRLEGFRSLDPHKVCVSGHDGHRIVLLVVPPEAAEDAAGAALLRAADPDNAEQPAQILIASGIDPACSGGMVSAPSGAKDGQAASPL
jgi:hypothetical protein